MSKIFGANWWTTMWGFILTTAGAIAIDPRIIAFLPDAYEDTVTKVAVAIFIISGGTFAAGVKSRNVTGGTVQQTTSGAKAEKGTQTLVDETVKASLASGEPVTQEQARAVKER